MTIFDAWEWPQYLLAVWWGGWFVVASFVWLTIRRHVITHWLGVICLNIILYFGGFWT
jgi:hypothetical protein